MDTTLEPSSPALCPGRVPATQCSPSGVLLGLADAVTSRIVPTMGRTISIGSRGSQPHGGRAASQITGMIQAGTAINPGNSGGALVNDIGLVAAKIATQLLDK